MSVSVDWVTHGGSRVMVSAGVCYEHFNDGILNAKREWRDPEAHCCERVGQVTHWGCLESSGTACMTAESSNFVQPLKMSGPMFHRQQSKTWSTLCEGDMLHCRREMEVTSDADWVSAQSDACLSILLCRICETDGWSWLTNTELDRFVNKHFRNRPFVYIEKVFDCWGQLLKSGGKNKSVAFIFLFSIKGLQVNIGNLAVCCSQLLTANYLWGLILF